MTYFSEKEQGERPLNVETISEAVWGGIQALVSRCVRDGSFGVAFPETCPDGGGAVVGTDEAALWQAMKAEVPNLQERPWHGTSEIPPALDTLDMIEFCWRCVAKPIQDGYHGFFRHHHLSFDVSAGRDEFRETVNRIFRRNGLVYDLMTSGEIERLAPPLLRDDLASAIFSTSDGELNHMLETARRKFLDPAEVVRREALEALWDAWERLKTLGHGGDKKAQMASLLDAAADPSTSKFRDLLEKEAKDVTTIGNSFQIRHSETTQEKIATSEQVDYLFHRLFALIQLIIRRSLQ